MGVSAIVLVPTFFGASIAYDAATTSTHVIRDVLGPAAAGIVAGIVAVFLARAVGRRHPTATIEGRAGWIIVVAALVGAFADRLPQFVQSFLDGVGVGYPALFGWMLVHLWMRDGRVREHIARAWSKS